MQLRIQRRPPASIDREEVSDASDLSGDEGEFSKNYLIIADLPLVLTLRAMFSD